jgi:hypothetical protein
MQELQETFNPNKMRENSLLEGNSIFRDKDRKLLKLPQLRRAGIVAIADVIQDDGTLRPRPEECATKLTLAMEWEAVRKYVWPTFQRLCYTPKSDLEIVRREANHGAGRKGPDTSGTNVQENCLSHPKLPAADASTVD